MQKIKQCKRDIVCLGALSALVLGLVLIIKGDGNIFASTTDWGSQHSAFLEYFRQLFYETGELLPSFAANIGMGQNIFNFAYYGLLSPYVLIYYLLPFARPEAYVMTVSILSAVVSVLLFYVWLRRDGRRVADSLFFAAVLALAAPFLYHSHRHVMFVIYMPFLVGALFGARRYVNNGRFGLLVTMCTLMIFTSFYYSPEALLCVFIVALYCFIKQERTANGKRILVFALKTALLILLSIAIAAVLLLPTAYALFSGRGGGTEDSFRLRYLIPQLAVSELLYDPYSLGMTAIFPISLFFGLFSRKRQARFLCTMLSLVMLFPVVIWAANGTLYLDGKVLIPFLPAAVLALGDFADTFRSGIRERAGIYVILGVMAILGAVSIVLLGGIWQLVLLYVFDVGACAIFLHMSYEMKSTRPLKIYTLVFMLCVCLCVNYTGDTLIKVHDIKKDNCSELAELSRIAAEKTGIWRVGVNNGSLHHVNRISSTDVYKTTIYSSTFNRPYNDCFYDVFNCEVRHRNSTIQNNSLNIVFNTFAAERFMISKNDPGAGYSETARSGDYILYENPHTLPFAWFGEHTLSYEEYRKLTYPSSAEALVKYAVCEGGESDTSALTAHRIALVTEELERHGLKVKGDVTSGVTLTADKGARLLLSLPENEEEILFIRFTLDPRQKEWKGDRAITINGVKNKLTSLDSRYHNGNSTFDFVISSDDAIEELDISFTRGVYNISDFEVYSLDYDSLKSSAASVTPFKVDERATKGDVIVGNIEAPSDGKLVFSIPYDYGFSVFVDDRSVEYECMNMGFVGIDMSSGIHEVRLSYRAPMLDAGIGISLAAIAIYACLMTVSSVSRRKRMQR